VATPYRLLLCAVLILLGLSVVVGWVAGMPHLKSVLPGFSTMKFNTALCFVASGTGIGIAGASLPVRRWSAIPAILLLLVSGATLVEYATGSDLGIDELLFADTGTLVGSGHPGRMSPLSAIAFCTLGAAILMIGLGHRRHLVSTGHYLAIVPGFVSFLAAAGYAFGAQAFWGMAFYTVMAVHTAAGLMLAVAATLATRPGEGWLSGFSDTPAARSLVIRLLPVALLLPVSLGLLLLLGSGLGAYNGEFAFALFVPTIAIGLVLASLWLASRARETELELYRSGAALRLSESRYRRIFEQTSDLIVTADLNQIIEDCNPSAAAAVGMTRDQAIGLPIASFVSPDDYERTSAMLRQKLESGGTTRYDVRVRSRQGEWLYWDVNSGLTYDEAGHPIGLHVLARDVTERKRAEEHQELLINELNHRVKNSLAVVQSLIEQTLRDDQVDKQVRDALSGRVAALAAAHNVVTRKKWEPALLRDVIHEALFPFCEAGRCDIDGPDLAVSPTTAVTLALAVHELATNAAKYGALKSAEGQISVRWQVEDGQLTWEWQEQGGPAVTPPSRQGFGTRMMERGLARQLGGTVSLDYCPDGLKCRVEAPLPPGPDAVS
jgi:PAS domain S-box-containing protein